jgi:hypothetical protein
MKLFSMNQDCFTGFFTMQIRHVQRQKNSRDDWTVGLSRWRLDKPDFAKNGKGTADTEGESPCFYFYKLFSISRLGNLGGRSLLYEGEVV